MTLIADIVNDGSSPEFVKQMNSEDGITQDQLHNSLTSYDKDNSQSFNREEFDALAKDLGMSSEELAEFLGIDLAAEDIDTTDLSENLFNRMNVTGEDGVIDDVINRDDIQLLNSDPAADAESLEELYRNFDQYDQDGDGFLSKQELRAIIREGGPDAEAAQTLLDNFNGAIFGEIDAGKQAWAGISKGDITNFKEAAEEGIPLEEAIWDSASDIAERRGIISEDSDMADAEEAINRYVERAQDRIGVQDDIPQTEALQTLLNNFDEYDTDGNGFLSKQELEAIIEAGGPDAEVAQTLLDNYNGAIFGEIDPGVEAWAGLSENDILHFYSESTAGADLEESIWETARDMGLRRGIISDDTSLEEMQDQINSYVETHQDRYGVQDDPEPEPQPITRSSTESSAESTEEVTSEPSSESVSLSALGENFAEYDKDNSGFLSKEELQAIVAAGDPDAEAAQILLDNFNAAIFGNIDPGAEAWAGVSIGDIEHFQSQADAGIDLETAIWDSARDIAERRGVVSEDMSLEVAQESIHAYVENAQDSIGVQDDLTPVQSISLLQENFEDYDTDGNGFLEIDELQAIVDAGGPEAEIAQTLIDNFDGAIFGHIDPGADAWTGISVGDLGAYQTAMESGADLEDTIWTSAVSVAEDRGIIEFEIPLDEAKESIRGYVATYSGTLTENSNA